MYIVLYTRHWCLTLSRRGSLFSYSQRSAKTKRRNEFPPGNRSRSLLHDWSGCFPDVSVRRDESPRKRPGGHAGQENVSTVVLEEVAEVVDLDGGLGLCAPAGVDWKHILNTSYVNISIDYINDQSDLFSFSNRTRTEAARYPKYMRI